MCASQLASFAAHVSNLFALDNATLVPMKGGTENTTYRLITSSGSYVLTVLRKKSFDGAQRYAEYLSELGNSIVPVPKIYASTTGERVVEVAGNPAILSSYVHGQHIDPVPGQFLKKVGRLIACLHQSQVACSIPPFIRFTSKQLSDVANLNDRWLSEWILYWHGRCARALEDSFDAVPTHGDLFPDNLIWAGNDQVTLIDWEDGSRDHPLIDLGMAVLGLCCPVKLFDPKRLDCLLSGYRSAAKNDFSPTVLMDVTTYAAIFVAYRRYLASLTPRSSRQTPRNHVEMPQVLESIRGSWTQVHW